MLQLTCAQQSVSGKRLSLKGWAGVSPVPKRSTSPVQMRSKRVKTAVRRGVLSKIARKAVMTPKKMRRPKNTATAMTRYVFQASVVLV